MTTLLVLIKKHNMAYKYHFSHYKNLIIMKSFKNLMLLIAVAMLAITSCQKTNTLDPTVDDLAVVSDFAGLAAGTRGDSTDPKHKCHLDITQIDITTLSSTITTSISTKYPGSTINIAGKDSLGNFYIKITKADGTHAGLLYDANGNFVKELLKGMRGKKGSEVAISSLPTTIITYISTNYATATAKKAIKLADGSFIVVLAQTDGTYIGLSFDSAGVFLATVTVCDKHGKKKGHK